MPFLLSGPAAPRLPLWMLGLLQYLTPTLQLVTYSAMAVLLFLVLWLRGDSTAGELVAYITAAGLLPKPVRRPAATWFRSSLPSRRPQWWGRLSMAASLGLAFVVASLFMRGPAVEPSPEAVLVEMDWLLAEKGEEFRFLGRFW